MDIFYEPHKKMLKTLVDFKVDFILIGGFAVNYYGYNRPTGDMDIWLKPTNENKLKLINALQQFGFNKDSIDYVSSLDFAKPEVFACGEPPVRIDFLTKISGIDYNEADSQKVLAPMSDIQIPILQLHHLVLSKISNDRTKDKLDVEELQKIEALKDKRLN